MDTNELTYSVVSVELEPTHYKTDFWNAVVEAGRIVPYAIFTQSKNWSPDGGHNYLRLPEPQYEHTILRGRGARGALHSALLAVKEIVRRRPDAVLVCGYSHLQTACSLLICFMLGTPVFLFVDEFNIKRPPGEFSPLKWIVRESIRRVCFRYASIVLACGRRGCQSAAVAGCPSGKIRDFPYVVDVERIRTDEPAEIPNECLADRAQSRSVLFLSGRMIERKGLPSLLHALSAEDLGRNWSLWVEGAGPELARYQTLARELGLQDRCRFLGFCQYDLHSWLIRSADIVIVPSLQDNWGIVVDEGLQLGKTVISSDATGSGIDRIADGLNGYLFPAGDSKALALILRRVLNGAARDVEKKMTGEVPRNVTPADNANTLLDALRGSCR